jgi:hypothetical protein
VVSTAVPSVVPAKDTLVPDQSAISELLNLAWDMHEITNEHIVDVFDWFEQNKSPSNQPVAI